MTFSQGHCSSLFPLLFLSLSAHIVFSRSGDKPEEAHGDKRNPKDFDRWRELAKMGGPKERHTIMEQATIDVIEDGKPEHIKDIDPEAETL
jgi:hypothetical protein